MHTSKTFFAFNRCSIVILLTYYSTNTNAFGSFATGAPAAAPAAPAEGAPAAAAPAAPAEGKIWKKKRVTKLHLSWFSSAP